MLLSETRLDHWEGLAVSSQNSLFESAFPLGQPAESGLVSLSQEHTENPDCENTGHHTGQI